MKRASSRRGGIPLAAVVIAVSMVGPRPSSGEEPDPYAELRAVTEFDGTIELVEDRHDVPVPTKLVDGRRRDAVRARVRLKRVEGDERYALYKGTAEGSAEHHFLWHTDNTCNEAKVTEDGAGPVKAVDGADDEQVELMVRYEDGTYDWSFQFGPDLQVQRTQSCRVSGPAHCLPCHDAPTTSSESEPLSPSGSARLPTGTTTLSGSVSKPTSRPGEFEATRVMSWSFQPKVEELELVVHVADYQGWVPDPSRPATIRATLQKRGGGAPARKAATIHFALTKTSREPGGSINSPLHAPTHDFDLQFDIEDNAATPNNQLQITENEQEATTVEGTPRTEATVVMRAWDWGGSAELHVSAELEGGGHVDGELEGSRERIILLPRRSGGSHIADAWKESRGVVGLADDADDEPTPRGDPGRGGHDGDGLTLYEEYRGFHVETEGGQQHAYGDPIKKDFFVVDHIGGESKLGIRMFRRLSQLEVHDDVSDLGPNALVDPETSLVDFNRGERPYGRKFAVRLESARDNVASESDLGPGKPRTARIVPILLVPGSDPENEVRRRLQLAATIAHELLHSVAVAHHGSGDDLYAAWSKEEVDGHTFIRETSAFSSGARVTLEWENGDPVDLADVPDAIATGTLEVAVWGGEASGQKDCVMRYNSATAYIPRGRPNVRVIVSPPEPPGVTLCQSAPPVPLMMSSSGSPRYGDGSVFDCRAQICVNDRMEHE